MRTTPPSPYDRGQGREDLIVSTPAPSYSDSEPPEIEAQPIEHRGHPCLITTIDGPPGPHAVLHSPEEGCIHLTEDEADMIRESSGEWEPSRREKAMIHYAAEGAYEETAANDGHDTSLCYILDQIRQAQGRRSSYSHEPRRFGSAEAARH